MENTRWTLQKKLTSSLDVLLGFSVLPIRVISLLGVLAAILSLLYGLFIFLNAVAGNMEVPGFATLVTLIAFFHGLGLIMLGILGEYVWRIFDEVNKRPETVIDEVW